MFTLFINLLSSAHPHQTDTAGIAVDLKHLELDAIIAMQNRPLRPVLAKSNMEAPPPNETLSASPPWPM